MSLLGLRASTNNANLSEAGIDKKAARANRTDSGRLAATRSLLLQKDTVRIESHQGRTPVQWRGILDAQGGRPFLFFQRFLS